MEKPPRRFAQVFIHALCFIFLAGEAISSLSISVGRAEWRKPDTNMAVMILSSIASLPHILIEGAFGGSFIWISFFLAAVWSIAEYVRVKRNERGVDGWTLVVVFFVITGIIGTLRWNDLRQMKPLGESGEVSAQGQE